MYVKIILILVTWWWWLLNRPRAALPGRGSCEHFETQSLPPPFNQYDEVNDDDGGGSYGEKQLDILWRPSPTTKVKDIEITMIIKLMTPVITMIIMGRRRMMLTMGSCSMTWTARFPQVATKPPLNDTSALISFPCTWSLSCGFMGWNEIESEEHKCAEPVMCGSRWKWKWISGHLCQVQCVTVPKMWNDTDTFFSPVPTYFLIPIPVPVLFLVPNFCDTGSETFFQHHILPIPVPRHFSCINFFRYRFGDFFPVPICSDTIKKN